MLGKEFFEAKTDQLSSSLSTSTIWSTQYLQLYHNVSETATSGNILA